MFFQSLMVERMDSFMMLYLRVHHRFTFLSVVEYFNGFLSSVSFASSYSPIRTLLSKYQSSNVGRTP